MPGVPIGLRDLHYALLTNDEVDPTPAINYEVPERIIGAVQANINPNPSSESLFADDGPMETATTLGQITLELITADLPLDVQATLLGHDYDAANGILIRKAEDIAPWVAVGFRSLKSNGNYRYTWLTKGRFSVPELNHETKTDSINFQTPTINGSFVKREADDVYIFQGDENDTNFEPGTWFTAGVLETIRS